MQLGIRTWWMSAGNFNSIYDTLSGTYLSLRDSFPLLSVPYILVLCASGFPLSALSTVCYHRNYFYCVFVPLIVTVFGYPITIYVFLNYYCILFSSCPPNCPVLCSHFLTQGLLQFIPSHDTIICQFQPVLPFAILRDPSHPRPRYWHPTPRPLHDGAAAPFSATPGVSPTCRKWC